MEKRVEIAEAKMAKMAAQNEISEAKMAEMAAQNEIAEAKIKLAVGDDFHHNHGHGTCLRWSSTPNLVCDFWYHVVFGSKTNVIS